MNIETMYAQYQAQGYVLIPDALNPAEVAELQATTDRIAAQATGLTEENSLFDFEAAHTPEVPMVQRLKKPHRVDPLYFALAKHPAIFTLVQRICGENMRLSHSKINMKAAREGSPLEWHQDWAFAPHTNMSTCVASVMIDDVSLENGAMQVLPGSHKGPLFDHHDPELGFVGAVDIAAQKVDIGGAASLVGAAGTVSIHHPMTMHGSGANRSGRQRRILFLEYAASDAFPLFYDVDWDEYNARLLTGPATSEVRTEPHYIKLPFPSRAGSSIYKAQAHARARYFDKAAA
ncbi:phytanoyl-CoA dioxygenase family protein [Variovorax arabinosiphilus]|uniref:phytanoyl-CoA dioxygenase family protein n=1 Tax=Variovorax arabinosiphilus TaxID=3053498 RepID=UPI002575E26E|nr:MULTISPECIES: phytanoyl-CoA dioxygenase family protein [unclassified Variovorax]MDM0121619.1 phytanoyl-CoA dioxygenase family protein [Variovorax sp. J2L1-78]MDM0130680.1 phytanoyl-CoA dioxygenase family protein [Variovorax sp. J2L1-63]MDM0234382.1 phytanoyl-CoA dioxygenase family protein [Variovorax sp. J2R1-6]